MFKLSFKDGHLTISLISAETVADWVYIVFRLAVAMVGYQIHHSVFWSIMDFIFPLWTSVKWLIFHEVNVTLIKSAFSFFLK